MIGYTAGVEKRLNVCLRDGTIPDAALVNAISVAKIKCIEVAVERTHALRLEVGSYALMHDTGFELVDMLLCCKFAEGDSRILQQKLTRDRLLALKAQGTAGALMACVGAGEAAAEARAALRLARTLGAVPRGDRRALSDAMDSNWR
jgi:acyl-CoA oxidase